jgi:myo-inositol-1(or 4)-monophosphatase
VASKSTAKKQTKQQRPKPATRSGKTGGTAKPTVKAKRSAKPAAKAKSSLKAKPAPKRSAPKQVASKKPVPKKPAPKPTAAKKSAAPGKSPKPAKTKPKPVKSTAAPAPKRTGGGKPASPKKSSMSTKKSAPPKSSKSPAPAKAAPKKTEPAKAAAAPAKTAGAAKAAPAQKPAAAPAKPATKAAAPAAAATAAAARPVSKEKVLGQDFLIGLAHAIKEAVAPVARALKGREVVSTSVSGDASFELDRVAEKTLLNYLRQAKAPVAYYSEESGYSTFSSAQPKHLLVVDPVDGTRAAKSGFEGCTVSVASTRVIERPRVGDLDNACVMDILGTHTFYAERGKGVRVYEDGHLRKPKLSQNTILEQLTWSMTVPARPAELIFPTAARLIDLTSLKGGFFACNSTSFSLTRLLTGQLDACIDVANRYLRDIPEIVRDQFINAGRGNILGIAPYDLVAALLIAEEAGAVVTDAYGNSFDHLLLLDSSEINQQSLIAAGNRDLHQKLLNFFDTRIKQFETLLERRAAASAN